MSIIASTLTPTTFLIATDTIVMTQKKDGEPVLPFALVGTASKINHYPHLKGCVVALGATKVSMLYQNFISSHFLTNVTELYERTLSDFIPKLPVGEFQEYSNEFLSLICLFGYSEEAQQLVAYAIYINKDGSIGAKTGQVETDPEKAGGFASLMSPRITNEQEDRIFMEVTSKPANQYIFKDILVETAKQMHVNCADGKNGIAVGGELNFTVISCPGGEYTATTSVVHKFPDYDETVLQIKRSLARENAISNLSHQLKCLDEFVNAPVPAIHAEEQDPPV
jgi:hypothetical protein